VSSAGFDFLFLDDCMSSVKAFLVVVFVKDWGDGVSEASGISASEPESVMPVTCLDDGESTADCSDNFRSSYELQVIISLFIRK